MKKIVMLTKDNCPKCKSIQMYLQFGEKGAYDQFIDVVKLEDQEERFNQLVEEHKIQSVPVFIAGDKIIQGAELVPGKLKNFLEENK